MAQTKINRNAAKVFTGIHGLVYKLSRGRVGGGKGTIIVLGTKGRKSGKLRERPLLSGDHPSGWVVVASFSGHDRHPDWYLNLEADPEATVQAGGQVHRVTARTTEGAERDELWSEMATLYPDYDEYQSVTDREIPVLILERHEN